MSAVDGSTKLLFQGKIEVTLERHCKADCRRFSEEAAHRVASSATFRNMNVRDLKAEYSKFLRIIFIIQHLKIINYLQKR